MRGLGELFDRTFFKYAFAFLGVLLASFVALLATQYFAERKAAAEPSAMTLTP